MHPSSTMFRTLITVSRGIEYTRVAHLLPNCGLSLLAFSSRSTKNELLKCHYPRLPALKSREAWSYPGLLKIFSCRIYPMGNQRSCLGFKKSFLFLPQFEAAGMLWHYMKLYQHSIRLQVGHYNSSSWFRQASLEENVQRLVHMQYGQACNRAMH